MAIQLTLRGVKGRVQPASGGFAVELSSGDAATAEEIWRRARALSAR